MMRETTVRSAAPALVVVLERDAPIRFCEELIQCEREFFAWEEFIKSHPQLEEMLNGLFRFAGGLGPGDRWDSQLRNERTGVGAA
jgi:hypothetical protein